MRSSQFLVVPSLVLRLVTAQDRASEPTRTTSSVTDPIFTDCACATVSQHGTAHQHCFTTPSAAGPMPTGWKEEACVCHPTEVETPAGTWKQKLQCYMIDVSQSARDIGQTAVPTPAMSPIKRQYVPSVANDSCIPRDQVVPFTVAVYVLAEAVARHHKLRHVMGRCERFWEQDKTNTCIAIGNGAMVCQDKPYLPGCPELRRLLEDHGVDRYFGTYHSHVKEVVEDLNQLSVNQTVCKQLEGEGLDRCTNITGAVLACTIHPRKPDCDELSRVLRCHGLWVPRTVDRGASNKRRSMANTTSVALQEKSDDPEPVEASIAQTLDQLRQAGIQKLCDSPQEIEECSRIVVQILYCLIDWGTECQELADILDDSEVQIPGINDDDDDTGDDDGDSPFSFLEDIDSAVLLDATATSIGQPDAGQLITPVECENVCEQDLAGGFLCMICILLVQIYHDPPQA